MLYLKFLRRYVRHRAVRRYFNRLSREAWAWSRSAPIEDVRAETERARREWAARKDAA
jgi:hypothetical protein